jgi:hypothetical protein
MYVPLQVMYYNPCSPQWSEQMKKRKSTRETQNMVQTAIWLPRDVHERLKKEGGERGLGEEIRRLIGEALDAADVKRAPDEITDELLDQIKDIARDLSIDAPLWTNRDAFEAFRAAIIVLLENYQPPSDAAPEAAAKLKAAYGDEKPEVIGRILARRAIYAYGRERYGAALLQKLKDPSFVEKLKLERAKLQKLKEAE